MKTILAILFLGFAFAASGQPAAMMLPHRSVTAATGGGGGGASYAVIQTGAANGTSVTLGSTAAAGHTLVAFCGAIGGAPISSVSDANGDTFTFVANCAASGDYYATIAIYVCVSCVGGANSTTINCADSAGSFGGGYASISVVECSGVTAIGLSGVSDGGNGNPPDIALTTAATGFFLGGYYSDFSTATATLNGTAGTLLVNDGTTHRAKTIFQWLATSAGYPPSTYTANFFSSGGSGQVAGLIQLK